MWLWKCKFKRFPGISIAKSSLLCPRRQAMICLTTLGKRGLTDDALKRAVLQSIQSKYPNRSIGNPEIHFGRKKSHALRNLGILLASGLVSISGYVYYKVLYLGETVSIPLKIEFLSQNSYVINHQMLNGKNANNAKDDRASSLNDLVILVDRNNRTKTKTVDLGLLESLIDYYLIEELTRNQYIQDNFKLPINLEEFKFSKNQFTLQLFYNDDAGDDTTGVIGKEHHHHEKKSWLKRCVDAQILKVSFLEIKIDETLNKTVLGLTYEWKDVYKRMDLRNTRIFGFVNSLFDLAKSGMESPTDELISVDDENDFAYRKNKYSNIVIVGSVGLVGNNLDEKYRLQFKCYYDDEHRYQLKISTASLIDVNNNVINLW
ncbi:hypothetical protein DASC09_059220 [Saccharomycopsis crataegensis]|uniref:Uncharacterized protein n=1 Tax=Saccharomycopsis crataegensis TaxID=43959 RepID=A0AAV5QUI1_9ASCO|nr:hypothetical protein DASC09_059220 [Saccharomycopsis crataegensis]